MTTELRRDPVDLRNFLLVSNNRIVGYLLRHREEYVLGGPWAPEPRLNVRDLDAAGCLLAGCERVGIRVDGVGAADEECERVVAAAKMRRMA